MDGLSTGITAKQIQILLTSAGLSVWSYYLKEDRFISDGHMPKYLGEICGWVEFRNKLCQNDEDAQQFNKLLTGEETTYEHVYIFEDQEQNRKWLFELCVVTEFDEFGIPSCITGFIKDETTYREQEETLAAVAEFRKTIAQNSGIGGWELDVDRQYLTFYDDFRDMIGYLPYDLDDTIDVVCDKYLHPDDVERVMKYIYEFVMKPEGKFRVEYRIRHRDGHYLWIQNSAYVTELDEQGHAAHLVGSIINLDHRIKAEQQLRETNTFMVSSNPNVNLLFKGDGELIDCNPASLKLFHADTREIMLQYAKQLIDAKLVSCNINGGNVYTFKDILKLTKENDDITFEAEFMDDGKVTNYNIDCKKIPYEGKTAVVVYFNDITKIKQASKELEKREQTLKMLYTMTSELIRVSHESFESLVSQALKQIAYALNVDRVRIWKNEGEVEYELFHWSKEAENKGIYTVIRHVYELPFRDKMMRAGKTINGPLNVLPEKEREIFSKQKIKSLLFIPLFVGDTYWGFIGLNDLKREHVFTKEEENVLHSSGNIIAAAYWQSESTKNLIKAREDALESANAKSDFLSRMSHEIRTPINAIIGMTTIAKKTKDGERILDCLRKIESSSTQLLGIINDILDMSKIEADKFEIMNLEFDMEKMIENVFNVVQVKMDEKNINFFYDIENIFTHHVIGDELRLSQVFINLISNAIKFTPEYGKICMKIREISRDKNRSRLQIRIIDNGIGISEDKVAHLFDSFEQGDGSITRQFGGTGLGLSICKKIIHLMGGKIWAESKPGEGSSFIFEIELGWGAPCHTTLENKVLRKDLRILILDDSPDVLSYLSGVLASFSLKAETTESALQAIEMVKEAVNQNRPYDIIFIDWYMPEMSGGEASEHIRNLLGNSALIVMISASDWNAISEKANKYNIMHFLQKPILPSTLYNTLLRLLSSAEESITKQTEKNTYDWKDKTILLAEDIDINREIVEALLEDTGVTIVPAENGMEAVNLMGNNPNQFDLILMDVQMPILDGLSATRKIRELPDGVGSKIPIIAMTANAFKEDEIKCLEAGMNAHIAKPIVVEVLKNTLNMYLFDKVY